MLTKQVSSKADEKSSSKQAPKNGQSSPSATSPPTGPSKDTPAGAEGFGMARVFVYGSLKRGCGNNVLLQEVKAKCLGYDSIKGDFGMISFGGFPGVVRTKSGHDSIIYGELWAVDEEGLAALDLLESHPKFYERLKYRTDIMDYRAWMYTLPDAKGYSDPARFAPVEDRMWRPRIEETRFWTERNAA